MADGNADATGKTQTAEANDSVTLGPRDVKDAVRLIRMLLAQTDLTDTEALNPVPKTPRSPEHVAAAHSLASQLLKTRRRRARYFPQSMFGEPAWDIMLALYVSAFSERRHTISTLAEIAGAPLTTTLRWLDHLQQSDLVERGPSPTDKRVTFVKLTQNGRDRLSAYLEDVLKNDS